MNPPTELLPAEAERDSLRAIFDCMDVAVITTDTHSSITLMNPLAQLLTGWIQANALGVHLTRVCHCVHAASRQVMESVGASAIQDGVIRPLPDDTLLITPEGSERAIEGSAAPVRVAGGVVAGCVFVFVDVTERRRAEKTLQLDLAIWRKSELQYRRLFESARDGILILDESSGKIIDANPYMGELLGYDLGHFLGKELWEIGLFEDIAANQSAFRELQTNGYIRYDHLPLQTRDKRQVEVEFVSNTYKVGDRLVIQSNIRDSTERVRLERAVRTSLEEKEVLLKEVHHRVKNNLQVISSLLHLQSQQTQDPASVQMFRDSQNRVRSMALVHERLYCTRDLTHIDFTDYIESLATHLFSSHQVDAERIRLKVNVRDVRLSIDSAVPCGLLLNELISNCLKHAFRGRERGQIWIELNPSGQGQVMLTVRDDGVGLPEGLDPNSAGTFGMQLILDLADQLHGAIRIGREAGTTVQIIFTTDRKRLNQERDRP